MSDYMKEAERLSRVLEDIAQTALRGVENEQIRGHLMDAAALLAHIQREAVLDKPALVGNGIFSAGLPTRYVVEAAQRLHEAKAERGPRTREQIHDEERIRRKTWEMFNGPLSGDEAIQRGAVPDMYDRIAEAHDASLDEDHTGCRAILKECMRLLAAAPAPDHFRDAAVEKAWERFEAELQRGQVKGDATEMVAEPADDPDPLHLSRILHELAGAASLCWEPRPSGVFDSQLAIQFVEQALSEIRSRMTPAPAEVPMPDRPVGFIKPDTDTCVYFYEQDFYVLSNFSAFSLVWKGRTFPTSEHAYHWEKFSGGDAEYSIRYCIRHAPSAHEAFKIAERCKRDRRPEWDEVKVDTMREILRAKVEQHEYVRRKLLATGDRELIEDSWRDDFWGWGPNRNGKNMLGKLWMEIRAALRGEVKP